MDIVTYALLKKRVGEVDTKVDNLAEGFTYKGTVATVGNLPAGASAGDSYTVSATGGLYVYDGTQWLRIDQDLVDKMDAYMSNLADDYDTSTSGYAVNDYCIRGNVLYRCTTAVAVGESWTAGSWTQTTVGYELQNPTDIASITNAQIDALF